MTVQTAECGKVESACRCILPPGHETPCVCACGGSYRQDADGDLTVYAFPPMNLGFGSGGLNLTQEQAIEKANEYVKSGPKDVWDGLGAMFGWDDDDDWDDESTNSEGPAR